MSTEFLGEGMRVPPLLTRIQYIAVPVKGVPKQSIDREKMIELISIMQANSKLTIKELVATAVQKDIFESAEKAPHESTVFRALKRGGLFEVEL